MVEISNAISKLKRRKAPDIDNISNYKVIGTGIVIGKKNRGQ